MALGWVEKHHFQTKNKVLMGGRPWEWSHHWNLSKFHREMKSPLHCTFPYMISFLQISITMDPNRLWITGWWFGTFFIFPYIGNNHPNSLIVFRGVETTKQKHVSEPTSTIFLRRQSPRSDTWCIWKLKTSRKRRRHGSKRWEIPGFFLGGALPVTCLLGFGFYPIFYTSINEFL